VITAEVFGRGLSGEDAAAAWFQRYEQHNVNGMCEMANFVLQCTGCKAKVTVHDIEDVDNIPNKLSDIQDEYHDSSITEYPLISKHKDYAAFRPVLVDFFKAVIRTIHSSSNLYEDTTLWDNIQIWVDTMSSAGIRPFRHTATLISLTMSTALCQVARDLQLSISMSRRQAEAESKKKKVNQARVRSIQQKTESDEKNLTIVESILRDEFDVVFVHRYRDVDPKIRVECVAALGSWVITYRKMFLEGQYLRYLGWVLSDTVAQTRAEVVKQLKILLKIPGHIGSLRGFIGRFRSRMVEIGARDAEPGVRADTIELLDRLRDAQLLEPDDIDTIGQLIFDTEARVRKAVGKFFVSNLDDLYRAHIEPIADEQLDSILPKVQDDEDYLSPSRSWIKFKCLAETLIAYDGSEEEKDDRAESSMLIVPEMANMDSRYMLATQAIFPHMQELQEWESLAGYLLYDHSAITSDADDPDDALALRGIYKLNDGEEAILLEVLDFAVKLYLVQTVELPTEGKKKGRKTQASKDDVQEKQETAAYHLTKIIPQLLNKYGSVPRAASAILRLEHLLEMDLINELQSSETIYSALLDDINKQFMTHSDRAVLAEASVALLKAKSSEPAKEAADAKTQEMWDDSIGTLQNLLRNQNIEARGTLASNVLTEVSNTVSRLSSLASISDCVSIFETTIPSASSKKKRKGQAADPNILDLLLQLCKRGKVAGETDDEVTALEDDLISSVIKTVLFYFMWKIQSIRTSISTNNIRALEHRPELLRSLGIYRDTFSMTLTEITNSRLTLDPLRLLSLSTIMDLYSLISTLRHAKPTKESQHLPSALRCNLNDLIVPIPLPLQTIIMQTHDRLERAYAKKSRRKVDPASSPEHAEPAEDAAPIGSDSELGEDAEADATDDGAAMGPVPGHGRDAKKATVLLAEQHLCEYTGKLVLAVIAKMVDSRKHKERLMRNKMRLGSNYKEVLGFLEEPKERASRKGLGKKAGAVESVDTGKGGEKGKEREVMREQKKGEKSEPSVLDDDDIEDDDDENAAAGEKMQRGGGAEEEDGDEDLREQGLEEKGGDTAATAAADNDIDDGEDDEEQQDEHHDDDDDQADAEDDDDAGTGDDARRVLAQHGSPAMDDHAADDEDDDDA
jgi:cohesin complex subunit SA-1/2